MGLLPKVQRPAHRQITPLTVTANRAISPGFRTVTLTGDGLADLEYVGFDQMVRLFFPRDGQTELSLPSISNDAWIAQLLLQPKSRRPWVRNYTIRRFRPEQLEIDIDFVRHEDAGPAAAWAESASPGDPAGILDEGITYLPPDVAPPAAPRQLLVGDDSAVPAILAILECAPANLVAEVFLEVPTAEDIPGEVTAPEGANLHWITREDPHAVPGVTLLATLTHTTLPEQPFYTWVAGEQKLPTGLRRHLVNNLGVPKSDICFSGYWRLGKSAPG